MEYWLALAIGVGMGILTLSLVARVSDNVLAVQGYFALCVMLSIYLGAELVTGSFRSILIETGLSSLAAGVAWMAMQKWRPSIGVAIIVHGLYDAIEGPHTGVADWYPPLCAGFDFVVGTGLLIILYRRTR